MFVVVFAFVLGEALSYCYFVAGVGVGFFGRTNYDEILFFWWDVDLFVVGTWFYEDCFARGGGCDGGLEVFVLGICADN